MHRDRTKLIAAGRHGRVALLAIFAALGALAIPSTSFATRGLTTGFADPDDYQSTDASQRSLWFDRTADSGAGVVRLAVEWYYIVGSSRPADPTNPGSTAYDFSSIDGAVRDAQARGLKVLLTINHAPSWAEGPNRDPSAVQSSWKPNPSDLADFSQALAARYTGNFDPDGAGPQPTLPPAQSIQVWNEVNSSDWLTPQYEGKTAISPDFYRDMLNASYQAIKQVNPNMQVVTAGTDPYGDPPGGARVQPVLFWQQALCVKPVKTKTKKKGKKGKKAAIKYVRAPGCTSKVNFDVFAHHPIDNTGGGPLRHGPRPGDASTPDLGKVVSVLRAAERLGTVSSGRHPVWVTEFWWDSNPPNPVGAKLATQARWIEQSMYLYWKAGASAAMNFEIRDSTLRPDVHAGLQAGIYFTDGRPKPSVTAFEFPFVTNRTNRTKLEAWGKAPESGKLVIQRRQGSRWRTVKKLRVSKGGVFDTNLRLSGKQQLRAIVAGQKSLVWKQAAAAARTGRGGGAPSAAVIALIGLAGIAALLTALRLRGRRRIRRRREPGARAFPAKAT